MNAKKSRRRAIALPDFSEMFAESFGARPGGVSFRLRDVPNLPHDLAFLNGLIHDAVCRVSDISERGQRVKIALQRDTWETHRATGQLDQRAAHLTFRPARIQRVTFDGLQAAAECATAQLMLENLSTRLRPAGDEVFDNKRVFTVQGADWSLDIVVPEFGFVVELQDEA